MEPTNKPGVKTTSGFDLAFAIVVLTSYFVTFATLQTASYTDIAIMVFLGIGYISVGIYGYSYCASSNNLWAPILYFIVQIPLGAVIVYLDRGVGYNALILLPLVGQSVVLLSRGWEYGVNVAIIFFYCLATYAYTHSIIGVWTGLPTYIAGQIFVLVFTQMAVGEEHARKEVERLVDELADANTRLREYNRQIEELAIVRERNRLAREIHDGLGHYLTTIYMQIQASRAIRLIDPAKAEHSLEIAQNLTQEALADVRRSVAALRILPDENMSLTEKITRLVQGQSGAGIEIHLDILGNSRMISSPVELALFRTAQEGLQNIQKHARAKEAWLILSYEDKEQVILSVRDDGIGNESAGNGYGLIGLKERAQLLGGEFTATSEKGNGFTIEMKLPG
jgi:signal transduction histidine kinase